MTKPTHQDADLMLKFLQWGSSAGIEKSLNWLSSDDFINDYLKFTKKHPPGSKGYGHVVKVCGWYETIGTLYKQGLFNETLLFDFLAVNIRWERVENFAKGLRETTGESRMYENFEAMAKAQKIFFDK